MHEGMQQESVHCNCRCFKDLKGLQCIQEVPFTYHLLLIAIVY